MNVRYRGAVAGVVAELLLGLMAGCSGNEAENDTSGSTTTVTGQEPISDGASG